jgi:hypothetical protein
MNAFFAILLFRPMLKANIASIEANFLELLDFRFSRGKCEDDRFMGYRAV